MKFVYLNSYHFINIPLMWQNFHNIGKLYKLIYEQGSCILSWNCMRLNKNYIMNYTLLNLMHITEIINKSLK
jgi:hypothetical protein